MVCDKLKSGHNLWPKLREMWFVINRKSLPGGASNDQRGYQTRPWTHKKHPKHVLLGLKFASLNKYSSHGGIWHPKQGFFFFKKSESNDAMILPLNKYNLADLSNTKFYKNITELCKTSLSTLDFQKILPSYTNVCMKNNKYVRSPKIISF